MKQSFPYCVIITLLALSAECNPLDNDPFSLPISIAPEYRVTKTSRESILGPIPGQKPTTQIFVEVTRDEKKAYIFFWDGRPHRDLGPMEVKETWRFRFLGEDASIMRTSIFMGREQEVLVLHHKPDNNRQLMISSKDMNKQEFQEMLGKMRRK